MDVVVYDKIGKESDRLENILLATFPQKTITDAPIASFDDGAEDIPIKSLSVAIEPVQAGSGDPSYPDNVRPISGHTECNVFRSGKNLYDESNVLDAYIVAPSGVITASSTGSKTIFAYLKPGTYVLDKSESSVCRVGELNETPSIEKTCENLASVSCPYTFTLTESKWFLAFVVSSASQTDIANSASILKSVKISRQGDIATDDSEKCTTYTITFPSGTGTVYGGNIIVNQDGSGSLVVDRAMVDLGTLTWRYITDDSYAAHPHFASSEIADFKVGRPELLCSMYKSAANRGNIQNGAIAPWNDSTAHSVACRDDRYTDATTFTTAMSGVQLSYKLATPISIPLTAPKITTLLGQNSLWADCNGDVSVTYRADTALYIAKKIAEALNA